MRAARSSPHADAIESSPIGIRGEGFSSLTLGLGKGITPFEACLYLFIEGSKKFLSNVQTYRPQGADDRGHTREQEAGRQSPKVVPFVKASKGRFTSAQSEDFQSPKIHLPQLVRVEPAIRILCRGQEQALE